MSQIQCVNPFSGEVIGDFELESFSTQRSKVYQLKESQQAWNQVALEKRIELVQNALSYFENNREIIAKDICEQMGRPFHYAKGEVSGLLERANYMSSIAKETLAADVFNDKEGFERSIEHVALGTIFVISAWNYPLLITINSVIPALIAGNTVLLKHSGLTPKIGQHFQNAFKKLGEYDNLLLHSVLDHETTGKVIEELDIDHVIFTGSVKGGREILKHTSKKFMTPGLELGGKDAAYVHNDANIDYAVDSIVDGCMFNSGQSCCGIERVYVHQDIYEAFIEKAKKLIESYRLGDPKDETTMLGPLASAKAADYMQQQVDEALTLGAKLEIGGEVLKIQNGTFYSPTLLTNVNHGMQVMREENFGPILPVMKVLDETQALNLINDCDYGLTCSVFTDDSNLARKIARLAQTGTIFMNRCDYLDPALPWTGVKNSGVGPSLSKYGFYSVTRRKSYHFKVKI